MLSGSRPGLSAGTAAGISALSTSTVAEYASSKGPVGTSTLSTRSPFEVAAISVGTSGEHLMVSESRRCSGPVLTRTLKVKAALGATTW